MSQQVGVLDVDALRRQFPALVREVNGRRAVYFDGPAGSQVPRRVAEAVSRALLETNANCGGVFATSLETDRMLHAAGCAAADLFGAADPETIVFGPNMTTLTLALSRALGRTWSPGDEILVSRLDHDANVTPWTLAARDAGATVRHISVRPDDCTLDLDDLRRQLSGRTRLVAVGYASNAVGTINPLDEIISQAHAVGALVFVDAVHFAPHGLIDVQALGCDFLAASAYKFFGPHVGLLWGRRELLERVEPYKLRPAPDSLPGRWMTGTQSHEGIAGTAEAIDYLADLGRGAGSGTAPRRAALEAAMSAISAYERQLTAHLLEGLAAMPEICVWGITDPRRLGERVPTVALTHPRYRPAELARHLAAAGIFTWSGNYYALPLTESLGLEPDGMLRIGLLHYNSHHEVDRLLAELSALGGRRRGAG